MRDDVKKLFSVILELHAKKLALLQQLRKSQIDKQTLLRNDDMSTLVDRVEEDAHLMMVIDALNLEIAAAKQRICDISGIDYPEFDDFFSNGNDDQSRKLTALAKECLSLIGELLKHNISLEGELEKVFKKTGDDIKSLSRIRTLQRMLKNQENGI